MTLKHNPPIGSGSANSNSKAKKNLTHGAPAQPSTEGKPLAKSKSNLDLVDNKQQGKANINLTKSTPRHTAENKALPIGPGVVDVRTSGQEKSTENTNTYRTSGEATKSNLEVKVPNSMLQRADKTVPVSAPDQRAKGFALGRKGLASGQSLRSDGLLNAAHQPDRGLRGPISPHAQAKGMGSPKGKNPLWGSKGPSAPSSNPNRVGAWAIPPAPFGNQKEVVLAERVRTSRVPTGITEPSAPSVQDLQSLKERFINRLMLKGQKALARNIFLKALETLVKINLENTKRSEADKSKRADMQLEKAEKGQSQRNLAGLTLGKKGSSLLPHRNAHWAGATRGQCLWGAQPTGSPFSLFTRTKGPFGGLQPAKAIGLGGPTLKLFLQPAKRYWYTSINSNKAAVRAFLIKHPLRLNLSGDNRQPRNMAFHLPTIRATTFTLQDDLFLRAIENVKPFIELKSKRVAGSTFKIPFQITSYRQYSLAVRWLILASRQRPERHMINKLAAELFDAANSRGHAIKKRIEMHRAAEANRAYLHFRW